MPDISHEKENPSSLVNFLYFFIINQLKKLWPSTAGTIDVGFNNGLRRCPVLQLIVFYFAFYLGLDEYLITGPMERRFRSRCLIYFLGFFLGPFCACIWQAPTHWIMKGAMPHFSVIGTSLPFLEIVLHSKVLSITTDSLIAAPRILSFGFLKVTS